LPRAAWEDTLANNAEGRAGLPAGALSAGSKGDLVQIAALVAG